MRTKILQKQILPFISNDDLYREVKKVLDAAQNSIRNAGKNFYKNAVDPFSAVFDALSRGTTLSDWVQSEMARQTQKTLQNALGDFHQGILGSIAGWKNLGTGSVVDLKNDGKKIIAEIKNKHNTTKGNHKVAIYDDFYQQLKKNYNGYTAYYVEVIPKDKKTYDNIFTPSDNRKHRKRPVNKKIRRIDGKSFYAMASGDDEALKKLYSALPEVICNILGSSGKVIAADKAFQEIFDKTF